MEILLKSSDILNQLTYKYHLSNSTYVMIENFIKTGGYMNKTNWEDLGIANDFLFGKVMRNPKICKKLIESILDIEIEHIEYPEEQKTIDIAIDARSVRLDVYVADGKGTIYNLEMQASDTRELPRRARYYQGMIDLNLIEKGERYWKLNDCYIIFICTFDIFGKGRHIYTFENICKEEEGLRLSDGTTKVFLNAAGTKDDVSGRLKSFLSYVAGKGAEDSFTQELDQEIRKAKQNEEWRQEYMTLLMRDQENLDKGIEIGEKRGEYSAKIEIAMNMLVENFEVPVISRVSGLTLEEITALKNSQLPEG